MAEDLKAASAIKRTVQGVALSNNVALNYMTIPQIKAAREILKGKMNGDLDPTIQNKFKRLDAQYAHAMNKINNAYNLTLATGNSHVKSLVEGKRDMVTLARIATAPAHLSNLDKKNLDQYGRMDATADFFKELNKSIPLAKVGLGVGIGLAGLGAISLIPGSMPAIGAFLAANPAFTALVAAGAGLALAVKVIPAIYKAAKKVQENRAAMESAKVDMNESAYETQEKARQEKEAKEKTEKEAKDKAAKEKADQEAKEKADQEAKEKEEKEKEEKEKKEKERLLSEQAFKSASEHVAGLGDLTEKQAEAKLAEIKGKFPNLTENQLTQIQITLRGKTLNKAAEEEKPEVTTDYLINCAAAARKGDNLDKMLEHFIELHPEVKENQAAMTAVKSILKGKVKSAE